MKHLFMLALALVMTCTFAFAQSQSPYSKGKAHGKQLITLTMEQNMDRLESLVVDIETYMTNNINTEEDMTNYLEGLEAGMREACKAQGFSDEETDAIMEMMGYAMLEGMQQTAQY